MDVIFDDENKKILGEVEDIDKKIVKVRFLGEVINNKFIPGVIRKPTLQAQLRVITRDEVGLIVGEDNPGSMVLGVSPLYDDYPIRMEGRRLDLHLRG